MRIPLKISPSILIKSAPPPHITWTTFSVLRTTRQTTVDKTPNSPDSTEPAEAAPVAQDLNSDIMGYFDTLEPKYPSGNLNNLSDRNTFIPRIPLNALEDSIMDDGDGIASAVVARSDEQVPAAPEENSHLIPPINTASLSASNGNIYPETLGTGRRQRAGSEKKSLVTENCGPEVTATFEAVTKVEAKCVQVIDYLAPHLVPSLRRPYGRSQSLNTYSWQTLIALHETLLYEYKDLMLGIQHPAASPGLGRLALECSMPARMWKHGCHSLLELLRRFLPITRDHMVRFISIAYRIYAALYKTVSQFSGTWAEVLGGLAKRRANIAGEDIEEHKYWQRKSQEWYTSAADRNPSEGRFYHHLATLSQPAHIKQLYYICRSLTSGTIFPSAREMIITQFSRGSESSADPRRAFLKHFTRTHFSLFRKDFSEAHQQALEFLRSLDVSSAYPPTRWLEESTQIAIINVASLLDYGNPTPLRYAFDFSNDRSRPSATGDGKAEGFPLTSGDPLIAGVSDLLGYRLKSELIFDTMETICSFNMGLGLPHFHVVMAFLFSLAKTLALTRRIFASGLVDLQLVLEQVPWGSLCEFLNGSIFNIPRKGHVHPFPLASSDPLRPLPEDYMLRGLIWTADYFPSNWFETHVDMDDRFLDSTSSSKLRVERIIWLAHQLCSV